METEEEIQDKLDGFIGSERLYQVADEMVLSEGGLYLVQELNMSWFFNGILEAIRIRTDLTKKGFYVWKLSMSENDLVEISCTDGDKKPLLHVIPGYFKSEITDLPITDLTVWSDGKTYYLPSEY